MIREAVVVAALLGISGAAFAAPAGSGVPSVLRPAPPTFSCTFTAAIPAPPAPPGQVSFVTPRTYRVDLVGGALPGTCKAIELRKGNLATGPVDFQGQTTQFKDTKQAIFATTELSNGPANAKISTLCTAVISATDCPVPVNPH